MSHHGCDEVRPLLPAHLDGDLDPLDAARVRDHLEGCSSCREHLGTMRLAVEALRRLPELPPPASILAGVRSRLHPVPWHRRILARRPWLAGVPVGALATALVVIGVALFQARYPRLPQVATEQTAPSPGVTGDVPQLVPQQPAPAAKPAPPESARTAAKPAPAPAGQKRPVAPPRSKEQESRVEVTAPQAPTATHTLETATPPERIVIPQAAPEREPPVATTAIPRDTHSVAPLPPRIPTVQPRTFTDAFAPKAGLRMAGAPQEAPLPPPPEQAPETIEAITVLLAAGEDPDAIRQLVRRDGGRTIALRVLEPRERREAFAPHRDRAGLRGEVGRGWELIIRMPRRAVAGFAESLGQRPGRLVLEQRTAPVPPRARLAETQDLRITILR